MMEEMKSRAKFKKMSILPNTCDFSYYAVIDLTINGLVASWARNKGIKVEEDCDVT